MHVDCNLAAGRADWNPRIARRIFSSMEGVPPEVLDGLADRYRLEAVVGRGGMATVYRAADVKHARRVAVKILRPDLAASIGTERFLREIEIAAQLSHPHILPLYDSGEVGGVLYYVMPFVDGDSLRDVLNRLALMDLRGALEIVRRVADALDYAHRRGVVHRDIKPENILLPDGHAVVADFGIAKALSEAGRAPMTRTGIVVGTPGYMSPEQAAGLAELDARTDVYSLGVVAYEMLMGGLPGAWISEQSLRRGRFLDAPPEHRARLDRLPGGMERVLVQALAVRREDRFHTPAEFAAALECPEDPVLGVGRASDAALGRAVPAPVGETRGPVSADRPQSQAFGPTLLVVERELAGELPAAAFPLLLEEIRATFGVTGHAGGTDRSLLWTARRPKQPVNLMDWEALMTSETHAPQVLVRVVSNQGRTRIRAEQKLEATAGGVYGGIVAAGGLGLSAAAIAGSVAFFGDPFAGIMGAFLFLLPGSYLVARVIYTSIASSKRAALQSLVERLADHCEVLAR